MLDPTAVRDLQQTLSPIHHAVDPREGLAAVLRHEPALRRQQRLLERLAELELQQREVCRHIREVTEQIENALYVEEQQ